MSIYLGLSHSLLQQGWPDGFTPSPEMYALGRGVAAGNGKEWVNCVD